MRDLTNIDLSSASEYVKKATILAYRNEGGASYNKQEDLFTKDAEGDYKKAVGGWGCNHEFPGPHWTIVGAVDNDADVPGGRLVATADVYGCALDEFAETYVPVEGRENEYRKAAKIRAAQQSEPFSITTTTKDGNVESEEVRGEADDWVALNPGGERYKIAAAAFAELYEQVPEEDNTESWHGGTSAAEEGDRG